MASLRDTVKDYQEELRTVSLGWRFGKRDVLGTLNISTLKWATTSTLRTEAAWKKSNRLTLPPLW